MPSLLIVALLVVTFATSLLLTVQYLWPSQPTVAAVGLLIMWVCNLILPVQCLALLDLFGLASPLNFTYLLGLNCALFLGVLLMWFRRTKSRPAIPAPEVPPPARRRFPWHVRVGFGAVLCVYGLLILRIVFSYPDDWDGVAYHYPVALRWLQEGTLRITSSSNWRISLPGNVEILDVLVLFTGHDRLLGLVQWPGLIILAFACLDIVGRVAGSGPVWPVLTTVLMLPMVARQSVSGYVDLFCTATIFGALTLILEWIHRQHGGNKVTSQALLFTAGLGCGLAAGAKPVYWLYAGVLVIGTTILLLRSPYTRLPYRWRDLSVFLAGCVLPSAFWFTRAAVCTGNPFYPFAIHIGSLSLPGVTPSDITARDYYLTYVRHWAEWFVYPWLEWKSSPGFLGTNYTTGDGLGGAFATFVMPGLIYAAWLAKTRRPALRPWVVALSILAVLWWIVLQKVGRFGLPLWVLAAITSAPFFELLERRATMQYRRLYVAVFAITAAILMIEPCYTIAQIRHSGRSRATYYAYPPSIDALTPGSKVLNAGLETLNFPLAGNRLSNRVVPSWEKPAHLTSEFLLSKGIDYVVERVIETTGNDRVEPPVEGLEMYWRGTTRQGERRVDWRIWSTARLRNCRLQPAVVRSTRPGSVLEPYAIQSLDRVWSDRACRRATYPYHGCFSDT